MASEAQRLWPILALLLNALTWGLAWWPLRRLQASGLHPLWATVLIYGLALVALTLWRPQAWRALWRERALWWLVLASGTTNACFNWGVTSGDVVRVVLLFYLMPLWAALLARPLLGEVLGAAQIARAGLALAGAAVVLWPSGDSGAPGASAGSRIEGIQALLGDLPLPHTPAEWLGLLGGFSFALNNVLLRREAGSQPAARALAMFLGGAAVSLVLGWVLGAQGRVPWPPAPAAGWVVLACALAGVFLCGNLALQFGAVRLPASVTAVVMVSEVLFASGSAVVLGAATLTPALLLGALLIVGATWLSQRA
jgi:drug/metabolite transporter (DMT)-like permease